MKLKPNKSSWSSHAHFSLILDLISSVNKKPPKRKFLMERQPFKRSGIPAKRAKYDDTKNKQSKNRFKKDNFKGKKGKAFRTKAGKTRK